MKTENDTQSGTQQNGTTSNGYTEVPHPQSVKKEVPGYPTPGGSGHNRQPSTESPPQRPGVLPHDINDRSILIPDQHEKIVHLACSYCGNAIEMTDNLIESLIGSGSKSFEELLMKKIMKGLDEQDRKKQKKTVKTEVKRENGNVTK